MPGLLQFEFTVRGNDKRDIFLDDQDRGSFLVRFSDLLTDTETKCYVWSLKSNHFHLLVVPHKYPLPVLCDAC